MVDDDEQRPDLGVPGRRAEATYNLPVMLLAVIAIILICGLGSWTAIKIVEMLAK